MSNEGFDKISFELGQNAEGLKNLGRMFEQHCEDDDRRHGENVKLLTANNDAIKGLADTLAPVLVSYKLNKRRLALAATMGIGLLIAASWALEVAVKWAVGWLLKIKFGV